MNEWMNGGTTLGERKTRNNNRTRRRRAICIAWRAEQKMELFFDALATYSCILLDECTALVKSVVCFDVNETHSMY